MEVTMSALLTGFCPNCGNKLRYESNDSTVMCNACDSAISITELTKGSGASDVQSIPSFMGFDNPESGVVFLENFFDTYDWESYKQIPDIAIEEIAEVIGNNKIKNGAIPETWYLDFFGLYVPVSKKFEALAEYEQEIIDRFDPVEGVDMLSAFDNYRLIARTLLDEKESIIKKLEAAVKYAERFSLKADRLADMKAKVAGIEKLYAKIVTKQVKTKNTDAKTGAPIVKTVVIDKIEDLPTYEVAKKQYSSKSASDFTARGIDAAGTYSQAIEALKAGNTAQALPLFESIRAYADSARYIDKINNYFHFAHDDRSQMYRFAGRHFIYKMEEYTEEALNLKGCASAFKKMGKKKGADAQDAAPTFALSLYEIVDGVPAKESTVKGIEHVITCYGTKLFFFKINKGIACFDLNTGFETMVDTGDEELYKNADGEYEAGFAKHGPFFYVKKKFREDIKGCLGKKKGVKENELNPYTLLLVDMATNACRVVVSELEDIKLRSDDKLFYSYSYKVENAKGCFGCLGKKEEKPKSRLMVCDLVKGTTTQVLDDDCDIHEVKGESIIYTLWKPNTLNKDLYVYDMEKAEKTLIEKNIFYYFGLIQDKIYYTIGNAEFRPLVRANFDGTEREQVLKNIRRVEYVRGNWFYVTKGYGFNSVLMKVKVDGSQFKVLCYGIDELQRFEGNYIYYSTYEGRNELPNLRAVRIDGKEDRLVAEKVKTVFPAEDGLYYCRDEKVEDNGETALSLYHMDKDGKNIRKIVFNVDTVKNDPVSNMLYYSKRDVVRYKVYQKGKEKKATFVFLTLTRFYAFKKAEAGQPAEEPKLILTLGLPEEKEAKGCIGKFLAKFKKPKIYEEAPIVHSYRTRGLSDAEIHQEDVEELINDNTPAWMPKFLRGGAAGGAASKGCAGAGSKKGCAGAKSKKAKGCSPKA